MKTIKFIGAGEIWTGAFWKVGITPWCALRISEGLMEMEIAKTKIKLTSDDIIATRSYRLPLSSITVISQQDGENTLISFSPLTLGSKLERCVEEAGFTITDRVRWRTGLEAKSDGKRYQLEGS